MILQDRCSRRGGETLSESVRTHVQSAYMHVETTANTMRRRRDTVVSNNTTGVPVQPGTESCCCHVIGSSNNKHKHTSRQQHNFLPQFYRTTPLPCVTCGGMMPPTTTSTCSMPASRSSCIRAGTRDLHSTQHSTARHATAQQTEQLRQNGCHPGHMFICLVSPPDPCAS